MFGGDCLVPTHGATELWFRILYGFLNTKCHLKIRWVHVNELSFWQFILVKVSVQVIFVKFSWIPQVSL